MIRLSLFLCLLLPATMASAGQPPNVLLILADDMGYSDAGCYGGEISTPHLDGLARDGLRFTQFYNTSRCWPTRAALLTGYYAQQVRRDTVTGVPSGAKANRPGWARLLPERLKPRGYRSYHSGKWHIDGSPLAAGFDHSYVLGDEDRYFSPKLHMENDKALPPVKEGSGYYATTAIADHALKCLKEHAAKHASQPFFSYVAFTSPHFPLHAPKEDIARYREIYQEGWDHLRDARWKRMKAAGIGGTVLSAMERNQGPPYPFPQAIARLGPGEVDRPLEWENLTDTQREFQASKMAVHAAMVDRMDREIGRILAQLDAMGAADNTLVMFLSDNGASAEMMIRGDGHRPDADHGSGASYLCLGPGWSSVANTPFRKHKTWVHEGGISTPFIVRWPAMVKDKNTLRDTPAHVIDVVPTVAAAAGIEAPKLWNDKPLPPPPGKNLLPAFSGTTPIERDCLWWLHEDNRAIRIGDWKLVSARSEGRWELYNLANDRAETKDLATKHPDKVKAMAAQWDALNAAHAETARTGEK